MIRRAIAHALAYPGVLDALMLSGRFARPRCGGSLVITRPAEIDGGHYGMLNHAIDRLEGKHPVATTILLALQDRQRASASLLGPVRYAARDLARAAALAPDSRRDVRYPNACAYFADIKTKHARKTSFWPKVQEVGL